MSDDELIKTAKLVMDKIIDPVKIRLDKQDNKIEQLEKKLEDFMKEPCSYGDWVKKLEKEISELRQKVSNPEWLDVLILDLMKPRLEELKKTSDYSNVIEMMTDDLFLNRSVLREFLGLFEDCHDDSINRYEFTNLIKRLSGATDKKLEGSTTPLDRCPACNKPYTNHKILDGTLFCPKEGEKSVVREGNAPRGVSKQYSNTDSKPSELYEYDDPDIDKYAGNRKELIKWNENHESGVTDISDKICVEKEDLKDMLKKGFDDCPRRHETWWLEMKVKYLRRIKIE